MSAEGRRPSDAEIAEMSAKERAELGMALDDVELIHYEDPFPVRGTRAEKRTQRKVAFWFALAALAGLAFVVVFIAWPYQYEPPGEGSEHFIYSLYTPLIGILLGLTIFGVGIGLMSYAKHLLPHETAVQQRHDPPSDDVDRQTTAALFTEAGNNSGIARRSLIKRTAGAGVGVLGLALGVFTLGGLIRNPWSAREDAPLWQTGWENESGETVYLRQDTGNPDEVVLVRPGDMAAGAMMTVFPFRESQRGDHEALLHALRRADNPVMLFRLRPGQATQVVKRAGQEDFNYHEFYAYSKICTHVGCPTSLYEQQTARILCPCHQSQFDLLHYTKPIFGPATRALPQLPITVDEDGYFVARGGFIEPIGPAFWERRS